MIRLKEFDNYKIGIGIQYSHLRNRDEKDEKVKEGKECKYEDWSVRVCVIWIGLGSDMDCETDK